MQISDFKKPEQHPFGMLEGRTVSAENVFEKEKTLAIVLIKCVEQGSLEPVELVYDHPELVQEGFLEKISDRVYKLTEKSLKLLYKHYNRS